MPSVTRTPKIIEVRNNVHVKNIRNEELETEKLIWD